MYLYDCVIYTMEEEKNRQKNVTRNYFCIFDNGFIQHKTLLCIRCGQLSNQDFEDEHLYFRNEKKPSGKNGFYTILCFYTVRS